MDCRACIAAERRRPQYIDHFGPCPAPAAFDHLHYDTYCLLRLLAYPQRLPLLGSQALRVDVVGEVARHPAPVHQCSAGAAYPFGQVAPACTAGDRVLLFGLRAEHLNALYPAALPHDCIFPLARRVGVNRRLKSLLALRSQTGISRRLNVSCLHLHALLPWSPGERRPNMRAI